MSQLRLHFSFQHAWPRGSVPIDVVLVVVFALTQVSQVYKCQQIVQMHERNSSPCGGRGQHAAQYARMNRIQSSNEAVRRRRKQPSLHNASQHNFRSGN